MQAPAIVTPQFLTRTSLLPGEYRANFRQVDQDAIRLVRSQAARQVTKLMAHIYLCLVDAPIQLREREGVLRFAGEIREGKTFTAWEQLTELLEVADGTAHKALQWMAQQKLIGYHAGKNGVGIRIFLNRAVNSVRQETERKQKNLRLAPVASHEAHVSSDAIPFNNYGRKIVDEKINPHPPKNGAEAKPNAIPSPAVILLLAEHPQAPAQQKKGEAEVIIPSTSAISVDAVVERIKRELEPCVQSAAVHAATYAAAHEHQQTREWLDKHGLPKAARVAQREAYNIFKHHGRKVGAEEHMRSELTAERRSAGECAPDKSKQRTTEEIGEVAEMCLALLEVQSRPLEQTLVEISGEEGWLSPLDVPKVREAALAALHGRSAEG